MASRERPWTSQGPEPEDVFLGIVERGSAMLLFRAVGVEPVPNQPLQDSSDDLRGFEIADVNG